MNSREMQRPTHRIDALTLDEWPHGLQSAEESAQALGIGLERLRLLADGGFAPHYRIDGGPPRFKVSELKRWAAANLVERVEGCELPAPVRIMVPAERVQDHRNVPVSLRQISGLCDITGEMLRTGIYFLCRDLAVLYVGQSRNVGNRITEHFKRYDFDTIFFLPWPGDDLDRIEAALIRSLRPPINGRASKGEMRTSFSDKTVDASVIALITNQPNHDEKAGNGLDTDNTMQN